MSHLSKCSSEHLLTCLTGLIRLQQIALLAKELGINKARKLGVFPKNWGYKYGICSNISTLTHVNFNNRYYLNNILVILFKNCPSSTGNFGYPVKNVNYSFASVSYHNASPSQFWGDHPYADNRRQILQECIDQLRIELKSRDIDVG